jgi:hypothetical protein
MRLSTTEFTIVLKAPPMITPTARSITFPFEMKSLKSLNSFFIPPPDFKKENQYHHFMIIIGL